MNSNQLFVIAIISMFLITPFASAERDSVNSDITKIDGLENVTTVDKTKQPPHEITNRDKEIKGKITITDSSVSDYSITKKADALHIAKNETDGEHTTAIVTIPKSELSKIDDGDGRFGYLRMGDNGEILDYKILTTSQLERGYAMTFSDVVVSGYTGYWQGTYSGVTSGTTLDTPDVSGHSVVTYTVDGTVPTSTSINENDASTYPSGAELIIPFTNNSNSLINSRVGTDTNVVYSGGNAYYNGVSSVTSYSNTNYLNISSNKTIHIKFKINSAPSVTSWLMGKYDGSGPTGWYIYTYNDGKIRILSATTVSSSEVYYITSANYADAKVHDLAITFDTVNKVMKVYMDGKYLGQDTWTGTLINKVQNAYIGSYSGGTGYWLNCNLYNVGVYGGVLSNTSIRTLAAGSSGISVRPIGFNSYTSYNVSAGAEKQIATDTSFTGLYYLDSSGGTHNVTVKIYFTEDVEKTTETADGEYQNMSITHTKQNATASVGTISYMVYPLYSGTPTLSSNNTNATISRNNTHVIVSTGLIKQGQSFYYNISVQDDHDHGMWLLPMKWTGSGWDFVDEIPTDYTKDLRREIQVTVS